MLSQKLMFEDIITMIRTMFENYCKLIHIQNLDCATVLYINMKILEHVKYNYVEINECTTQRIERKHEKRVRKIYNIKTKLKQRKKRKNKKTRKINGMNE